MITQKDISAACGVSVAAVSRALNNHPDISDETRQMIVSMADKMGYHKTLTVRDIPRSFRLGILVLEKPESSNHHAIIIEIRQCLLEIGYDVVMLSPSDMENIGADRPGYLPRARLLGLEGIFIFCTIQEGPPLLREEYASLRKLVLGEIPIVAVDCTFFSCSSVAPAYSDGLQELFDYVRRMGHTRTAIIYGGTEKNENTQADTHQPRTFGTQTVKDSPRMNTGTSLRQKAIEQTIKRICPLTPSHYIRPVKAEDPCAGFEETTKLLQDGIPPTCIIYGDEYLLEGGTAALIQQGVRIPRDISIASMFFSDKLNFADSPLTRWHCSPTTVAAEAVDNMLTQIRSSRLASNKNRRISGALYEGRTVTKIMTECHRDGSAVNI